MTLASMVASCVACSRRLLIVSISESIPGSWGKCSWWNMEGGTLWDPVWGMLLLGVIGHDVLAMVQVREVCMLLVVGMVAGVEGVFVHQLASLAIWSPGGDSIVLGLFRVIGWFVAAVSLLEAAWLEGCCVLGDG